jgi:DNA uptake protein ComE-like DNA-binding protein
MLCALVWLTACSTAPHQESDARLQQQAERATVDAKHDAKIAAENARIAAADAERKVNAIAAGVKDGLKKPAAGQTTEPINVNSAGRTQLESLPGIGDASARRIIDDRPYATKHDLVRKGAISSSEYRHIADLITTG